MVHRTPDSCHWFVQPQGQAFTLSSLRPLWEPENGKMEGFLRAVNHSPSRAVRVKEQCQPQVISGSFFPPDLHKREILTNVSLVLKVKL